MKKSAVRIICFLLILVLCLGYANSVFKVKYGDGIYDVTKFYELEDNSVDVLFLGSSHAFEDFNTGTLWDEYGMSSFILAGSVQPMWNTYYYLKEALKTQTPKLIVLEGYCTVFSSEFIDDSRIIKNNYGLHWSKDKVESLKISSPQERWREFFLEYTQYHTRYKELTNADFLKDQGNPLYTDWKGFGCNMVTTPLEQMDVTGVSDRAPLFEKTEKYYRATIELALEADIPIIVIVSPYAGINEGEQKMFNTANDIADEYDVPFLNCNLINNEIGMDWSIDAGDAAHLNYRGNKKFSKYIGQYLVDNYGIPDHRGDIKYSTWQDNANYIRQMIYDQELLESSDLSVITTKIQNDSYWIFVSVSGTCNTSDATFNELFDSLGIPKNGENGIWFVTTEGILWDSSMDGGEFFRRTTPHDFHMKRSADENGNYTNEIIIDNANYAKVVNGVNIVIYDTMTEKVADSIGFNADDGYAIVR